MADGGEQRELGSWAGDSVPSPGVTGLRAALERLADPVRIVSWQGSLSAVQGGEIRLGGGRPEGALPLLGLLPALLPEQLGDSAFRAAHGLRLAYVAGEMANGIASEELVEAVGRAGALGFFGAAGLSPARVEAAIDRLAATGLRCGFNLIHSPTEPVLEAAVADLYIRRGVHLVSASAYLDLTLPVVRYRVHGIHRDPSGAVVTPNRLMAKVSRPEVARRFLSPPPGKLLALLVERGELTREQAELAATIPMAEDLTAEADSGGHTDNRPLLLLLPELQAVRDELQARHRYAVVPRVGAAGGIATPSSVAAAFSMGAAYVMTGSVNQACLESGTSDRVRELLAQAGPSDVAMAPAADMFELGVKVQVLSRGTLFAVRAQRLHDIYRTHDSLEALPAPVRQELESKFFRCSVEEAWEGCRAFFAERDPSQLERAGRDDKHKLALVLRSYLGRSSSWANDGVADRSIDYQVWCGPSMGAFNDWVQGSPLASWRARRVVPVLRNLMQGAAVLTRLAALRAQGLELPDALSRFAARDEAALDEMLVPSEEPGPAVPARTGRASARGAFEPIAVVGMGCLFPGAGDLRGFLRLVRRGEDAVREIPAERFSLAEFFDADPGAPDRTYARRGAFLEPYPFDPTEFGIPPSTLEATDSSQLLALVAARMALEDAGLWESPRWNRARTAVILGVTGAQELVVPLASRLGHPAWRRALQAEGLPPDRIEAVVERLSSSWVGWQEGSFPGLLGNVVAGRIANRFDLGGTNCVIDAACASSLGAAHLACLELAAGRSDVVLTGGVDTFSDIFMHMCFSKTPALSPTGDARPFSRKADGTVLGEGLGILVLKRLADAEQAGERIHAVIRGIGSSSDGRARSIYAPLAAGQVRALAEAYRQTGFGPSTVGLVEAHGTGTRAGDAAELQALSEVFRADGAGEGTVALGSVKAQIGHTKAAAGSASLIKVALSLSHRFLPPTLKAEEPAAELLHSPFHLPEQARPWLGSPRRAAVSSFGFGGSNFHAVLEEHPGLRPTAWDGSMAMVAVSASSASQLRARVEATKDPAASRSTFRSEDPFRLVAVGDPRDVLDRARAGLTGSVPGVYLGEGPAAGALCLLFPGQGAQSPGMLAELSCIFPELLDALEKAGEAGRAIHPPRARSEEERRAQIESLLRTDVAQPALAAVESGLLALLRRFGVRPAMAAGHSFGELSALHAAGVFDVATLRSLASIRGALMAGDGEDLGAMLAVRAPLQAIEGLALAVPGVVLANRNAPLQGVLSGSREAIDRAEAACREAGLSCSRLPVGAAFHSPLVAPAAARLREALASVTLATAAFPVVANTTAEPYPAGAEAIRDVLAAQLARPVRFAESIEKLHALGARTFLEVGPRTILSGLTQATLGERPHQTVAIDEAPGGLAALAAALGRLAALGHEVALSQWDPAPLRERRTPAMVVPVGGANVRWPPPDEKKNGSLGTVPVAARESEMRRGDGRAPEAVLQALQQSQESLRALQALQAQTASAHEAFLGGQRAAQEGLASLLATQQRLLEAALGGDVPESWNGATSGVTHAPPTTNGVSHNSPPSNGVSHSPPSNGMVHPPPTNGAMLPATNGMARAPATNGVTHAAPADVLLAVVSELTGYPTETLGLDMELEADLGIDSIKRVEILSVLSRRLPDAPSVDPERLAGLRTLRQVLEFTSRTSSGRSPATPGLADEAQAARRQESVAVRAAPRGPRRELPRSVALVVSDPALESALRKALSARGVLVVEEDPEGLLLAGADPVPMLAAARRHATALKASGHRALLCGIVRMDGAFGHLSPAGDPAQASLLGLLRTAAREWPSVRCRALDVSLPVDPEAAAAAVLEELEAEGPAELGVGPSGRVTLALRDRAPSRGKLPLDPGDLVVFTGGGRGVTAACAIELASTLRLSILLLGRTPLGEADVEGHDAATIGRSLLAGGFSGTPRELRSASGRVLAQREIRATLAAIEQSGSRARYLAVDVRDVAALGAALQEARSWAGPVRAVLHGAGVLRDRLIEDTQDVDVAEVVDTKVAAARALLAATGEDPVRALVFFASVSGRFGRRGQASYAAANAALAGLARAEAHRRPHCRVVAVDWGAWDGGMVDASLRQAFAAEGVRLLPLPVGARALVQELAATGSEVVLAADIDPAADPGFELCAVHRLDPQDPLLADHVLDGKAVVPVALSASLLAASARKLLGGPIELHDLSLLRGLSLGQAVDVTILGRPTASGVELELRGPDDRLHLKAGARAPNLQLEPVDPGPLSPAPPPYPDQLFHGPSWQVLLRVDGVGSGGVAGRLRTSGGELDAGALDGIFQALVLWTRAHLGAPSLPSRLGAFLQPGPLPPEVDFAAAVRSVEGSLVLADASLSSQGVTLARLEGYVCTASPTLERAFGRREASAA